ncbi:uncharacterized protein MELLADRAFT_84833 [Melampsora larici-populina 98AG31]|uniref:Uncharacterized protein n=1 Tax=Melampsora larici-populina (strain 98AG31 / pathotype 3-4-7) TaxID=747676 RepID=F4SCM3_MELLP|nr:uncharacterized protein MELLADRAFT_84833 [Melampsora larici-populina 98AG31]EGF97601.1 hypothetical protein MELLADRAFT_84833 [Melampsora larici-populina 98AG31]
MVNLAQLLPFPDRSLSCADITLQHHDCKFRCEICGGRTMRDYWPHIMADTHQSSIRRLVDQQAAQEDMQTGIHSAEQPLSPMYPQTPSPPQTPISTLLPLTLLRGFNRPARTGDDDSDSDVSEPPMDFNSLKQALEALAQPDDEGSDADHENDLPPEEESIDETSEWYPFKNKET